ncbi:MAG: hypothetical protein JWM52_15 [Candidatus Saccharibacteria bacterium]|nr:hypothetical protein [Candidatus Saccharibacteria bacterium]
MHLGCEPSGHFLLYTQLPAAIKMLVLKIVRVYADQVGVLVEHLYRVPRDL